MEQKAQPAKWQHELADLLVDELVTVSPDGVSIGGWFIVGSSIHPVFHGQAVKACLHTDIMNVLNTAEG